MKLSKLDDEIMADFEDKFPDLAKDEAKIRTIDEDAMKSPQGKEQWRNFINRYEGKGEWAQRSAAVARQGRAEGRRERLLICCSWDRPPAVTDFNFGTLIRTDSSDEYTQFNTTFGESSVVAKVRPRRADP